MSRIVNIIFESEVEGYEPTIEDAHTGQEVHIGRYVDLEDGLRALQVRVMDLRNRTEADEICPCCTQKMPKPPDMTRRSLA